MEVIINTEKYKILWEKTEEGYFQPMASGRASGRRSCVTFDLDVKGCEGVVHEEMDQGRAFQGLEQDLMSTFLMILAKAVYESGGPTCQARPHTSLIWTQNSLAGMALALGPCAQHTFGLYLLVHVIQG